MLFPGCLSAFALMLRGTFLDQLASLAHALLVPKTHFIDHTLHFPTLPLRALLSACLHWSPGCFMGKLAFSCCIPTAWNGACGRCLLYICDMIEEASESLMLHAYLSPGSLRQSVFWGAVLLPVGQEDQALAVELERPLSFVI